MQHESPTRPNSLQDPLSIAVEIQRVLERFNTLLLTFQPLPHGPIPPPRLADLAEVCLAIAD
jgi:hypothetical protein